MIRTTFLKDLHIKADSSTPVEPFTNLNEVYLNVCFTDKVDQKIGTALAKSPGGTIVEIEYTNPSEASSKGSSIFYQL